MKDSCVLSRSAFAQILLVPFKKVGNFGSEFRRRVVCFLCFHILLMCLAPSRPFRDVDMFSSACEGESCNPQSACFFGSQ